MSGKILAAVAATAISAYGLFIVKSNQEKRIDELCRTLKEQELEINEMRMLMEIATEKMTDQEFREERGRIVGNNSDIYESLSSVADPVRTSLLKQTCYSATDKRRMGYLTTALKQGNEEAKIRNLPTMTLFEAIRYVRKLQGNYAPGMTHALSVYYGGNKEDYYNSPVPERYIRNRHGGS